MSTYPWTQAELDDIADAKRACLACPVGTRCLDAAVDRGEACPAVVHFTPTGRRLDQALVQQFLRAKLGLELSKATIAPVRRGVNFCGYRTWPRIRFVRRRALWVFRQAAKRANLQAIVSSLGHARRTASLQHMLNHLKGAHRAVYR